ncbi:MAG: hypothetical protein JNN07_16450 [Verrucomicrobiales bacterium]|nr:hypothetical protein [Verrucomicrobiales bacterium]
MKDFLHGFYFMAMLVVYVSDRSCTILVNEQATGPSVAPSNRLSQQQKTKRAIADHVQPYRS